MISRLTILRLGGALLLSVFSSSAIAVAPYIDNWRNLYPDSKTGDIGCQLCHLERDGGEPWNAYGNDIRQTFNQLDPTTRSIIDAIRMVESINSDDDSPTTTNVSEITANTQPAWREGRVNPAFDRNGVVTDLFFPPLTIDPFPQKIADIEVPLELVDIASGFTAPVAAAVAPVTALRRQLFVADQVGIVWRVNLDTGVKTEFLNLQSRLVALGAFQACGYDERGLLGLAFHPQYASNGRLYVHTSQAVTGQADFTTLSASQSANHQGVVTEITLSNPRSNSGAAQVSSDRDLLRFDQPQFNHNGGALVFDTEGLLYIGLGDGGGADDQGVGHGSNGNGNDPSNPFGAILRINPLGNNSSNGQYGIPANNPFISDVNRLAEIFAYGFRNPWKLSFDRQGRLLVADVGQNDIEEVNIVEAGMHYGWNTKEGRFFFDPNGDFSGLITLEIPQNLPPINLTNPVIEYDHDEGISITGGYAYQGNKNPSLVGKYIFADFTKRLFVGDLNTGEVRAATIKSDAFIYSLAEDADRELYLLGSESINTCDTSTTGKLTQLKSTTIIDDSLCLPIKTRTGIVVVICL